MPNTELEAEKQPLTSQSDGLPADTKDFCEHIRTVQLGLLGICLLLLGVSIRESPQPLATAIADIDSMAKLNDKGSDITRALQSYANNLFNDYSRKHEADLELGRSTYILGRWLDGTERSFRLDFPESWVGSGPFSQNSSELEYKANTPQEFQDFWTSSQRAEMHCLPAFTSAETVWFTDAGTRRPGNEGKVLVHTADLKLFQQKVHAVASEVEITSGNLLSPSPLTLKGDAFGVRQLTSPMISGTKQVQLDLPEIDLPLDLLPVFLNASGMEGKWRSGPFEQVFGELSTQMHVISGLTFKDAKDYLTRQSAAMAPEETVDILGAKLPITKINNWGIVIIVCSQAYLFILLTRLEALCSFGRPNVLSWFGLFPDRLSHGFTFSSCALLPVGVLIYLETKKWPSGAEGISLYIVGILLSALLCVGATIKLTAMWRKLV